MKIVLISCLLLLAACATNQPVLMSGIADNQSPGFATLADANNPVEMAAAPVVTHLAIYTSAAAKDLKAGRITKAKAIEIRENERQLRKQLEVAIAAKDIPAIKEIGQYLETLQ